MRVINEVTTQPVVMEVGDMLNVDFTHTSRNEFFLVARCPHKHTFYLLGMDGSTYYYAKRNFTTVAMLHEHIKTSSSIRTYQIYKKDRHSIVLKEDVLVF